MSRNFTNCLTMGAKYLEVVKRGSHPNNGWSPDVIRWRPHVTTLRDIKNLDSILEELLRIFKVHEQELALDEGIKNGKSQAHTVQRPKCNFASKAFAVNNPWNDDKKIFNFDLKDSSPDEDNKKETNPCLMAYSPTSKAKPTLDASSDEDDSHPEDTVNSYDEEVIFESREDLIKWYNQLLFASTRVSKSYNKLNKCFQQLGREHEDPKKAHQVHLVDFILEATLPNSVQDAFVCEEVKALLDEKGIQWTKNSS
ncbi:hypothetical protein GmHk_15G044468 [Glycine max]|nr:hypothetical protein GmHk_15G044468 [Glycine max]